jgi:outer membrane protein assembly factor BamB
MKSFPWALAFALVLGVQSARADSSAPSVTEYHNSPERSGHFVMPGLTWDRARNPRPFAEFRTDIAGHVYAQPLYWHPPGSGSGLLIAATESNTVYGLNADSGATVWKKWLGRPVPSSALSCGNIDPVGITGTPAIDSDSQTIYLDAFVREPDGLHHLIFALSLRDGSILPGWPVDVAKALDAKGLRFRSRDQNQRSALTIAGSRVYVPYGGHFGDCGSYHGWVVGVSLRDPTDVIAWRTRARGGGIWAPGGMSYDGQSLFVATGNTMDAEDWSDGEAVIRLGPDLKGPTEPRDFFAPRNWKKLDAQDADLGGSNPLSLDVPGARGLIPLVLALGKDGKAYLLDRQNLGGIGGALATQVVSPEAIRAAPAAFRLGDSVLVAFQGEGADCPKQGRTIGLTVLRIRAAPEPQMAIAWCGALEGAGAPIVTTSDAGGANPIVWVSGAEGDNRLHAFRGDTGEELTGATGEAMAGLRHFGTILAAAGRLYVASDSGIYAFAF